MNREQWLTKALTLLRPVFATAGKPIPAKVRVSVSFPSCAVRSRIGECWSAKQSADGTREIFITPRIADPKKVVGVLGHELAHASLPDGVGHKGDFVKLIRALGMIGKPTEACGGPEWDRITAPLLRRLGEFPHAKLALGANEKKQSTRMLKVECMEHGYIARVSGKWLAEAGAPLCPICGKEMNHK